MADLMREGSLGNSPCCFRTAIDKLTAPGASVWVVLTMGDVAVSLSGTATDVYAITERCAWDPASGDCGESPAGDAPFTGDLTLGVPSRLYTEAGMGWWRVRVVSMTAGTEVCCTVSGLGQS